MGMSQMLREFAPGRVSRRFATRDLSHRHWIPIPTDVRQTVIDISTILPTYRHDSKLLADIDGNATTLELISPDQLKVDLVPDEIKDSSNALLTWATQFTETGTGLESRIPRTDPIGNFVADVNFFLHAQNSNLEVR